uniref:Multidrug and toxin extrusion protein n=1 Tax=Macrostomum lignano TaxID=282301 RepID=A0A1I8HDB1_9PLAT
AVVETVLLYNAETWTLTDSLEQQVNAAHAGLLRAAFKISDERITNAALCSRPGSEACPFMLQTTSFIICGHMSKEDLDGVALGNSLINVAGMSIGMGMSTACDTLFSQTYGSRNRKRMGLYLQRSFLLMNLALLPLACLHLNIRPLLLLIGQAPEIAHRAALYMRLFLPGLLFQFNYLVLSRYLQNQSRMTPPMIAAFVANVFNASAQYVAIHVLDFSYLATAVVQAASMGMMFFITLAYILWTRMYRETWDGWKLESLYDWGDFIKLSVPGIFLIALEEWSFEVATIVAGMLGAVQLAAQSIVFQLESISYMIPFGMSVAVNIRVGQQLGANQPVGAARSYRVGLVMTVGIAVLMCNVFVFLRHYLPIIFTTQRRSPAAQIRGTGRQVEGAVLLFIGYYVIGLPIGIPLALLTDLQMTGIWLGLLAGIAAEAVAFCCLVLSFNWRREAEK